VSAPRRVNRGLYLAPFDDLADPRAVVRVAVAAEDAGWDGVFLWDHMWRPPDRTTYVGDAWIALAAVAARTSRIRLGPMVVPLARRRPQKVARESVALDHLSQGRLTLGVGLGVNTGGELARFGEIVDDIARGATLDEALEVVLALWSGETVRHAGPHYTVDDVRFRPVPLQLPRIPVWGAVRGDSGAKPLRRAAALDGVFPVGTPPEQLRRVVDVIGEERGGLDDFDVAVLNSSELDPESLADHHVTWVLDALAPDVTEFEAARVASSAPA
jgi:alkanesulfonate monooxygenase SsuD/methylene tetrahydromethanopterin reductase-like flavin-dependent oxidoreductase (luciferase family)